MNTIINFIAIWLQTVTVRPISTRTMTLAIALTFTLLVAGTVFGVIDPMAITAGPTAGGPHCTSC